MPSYLLHLSAANLFLEQLPASHRLHTDPDFCHDFLLGNLLPDTSSEKSVSHFRNPLYQDRIMQFPDLPAFLKKYRSRLQYADCIGYYFHLYIDRTFFKDYIPRIVSFYDSRGRITDKISEVETVFLRRLNRHIPFKEYLSDSYYYGDYTKMCPFLTKQFNIPIYISPVVNIPSLEEANYHMLPDMLLQIREFMKIPEAEIHTTKVFDTPDLLRFLKSASKNFLSLFYQIDIESPTVKKDQPL